MIEQKSQEHEILKWLKKGRAITPLTALEMFGCFRLSGRIYDLRKDGHNIVMTLVQKSGKRYGQYRLASTK